MNLTLVMGVLRSLRRVSWALAQALPKANPFRALLPGNLWELGLTRIGVFPEMTAFGFRLLMRWGELQRKHRFDVVLDNQSLSWGLLALQATGTPVAAMVHHPLHIDRFADFEIATPIDRTDLDAAKKAIGSSSP